MKTNKMPVSVKNGKFSIELSSLKLDNCVTRLIHGDDEEIFDDFKWKRIDSNASKISFETKNDMGKWSLTFSIKNQDEISIDFKGTLSRNISKLKLVSLHTENVKAEHVLQHGLKMGGCRSFVTGNIKKEESFKSYFMHMLTFKGETMQLSHKMMQDNISSISGSMIKNSIKSLSVQTETGDGKKGQTAESNSLKIKVSRDGHGMMNLWADENIEVKKSPKEVTPGWNSWDYYRWTITEDEVLKNAEFIKRDPVLSKYVKRIIVDDGWEYCYGEWDANPLFKSGMKSLADKITKMGFEPGLWFAPSIIEPHARIAQWDSEMLAKGESGLPALVFSCMKRYGFVLDPSLPKVQKWLYELFKRYTEMGYKYFKLDFLESTLRAPAFANPAVPRGKIVRKIVESVYKATVGKADILGCNYPFMAGNKYVDAVRVSADIHADWKHVCENVFSIASRFWSNGKFWINDPDFTLCRGQETSNDKDLNRLKPCLVYVEPEVKEYPPFFNTSIVKINQKEVEILLSLILISGGAINLSDDITKLNKDGLELARKTLSAEVGEAGIPLDLFSSEKPSVWVQRLKNNKARLLLINWGEESKEFSFDLMKNKMENMGSALDFWNNKKISIKNGRITAELKKHSCLLVELK
ncbi:MAG: hypothetical protein A2020_04505 [Lentisphaerae bacterium GWF2_45_14]|nr:MAG: hypothetical protein A2020_04505 [Lentisphaerae bacterium GWF2_45_14]